MTDKGRTPNDQEIAKVADDFANCKFNSDGFATIKKTRRRARSSQIRGSSPRSGALVSEFRVRRRRGPGDGRVFVGRPDLVEDACG
jgi:hypothetical protein